MSSIFHHFEHLNFQVFMKNGSWKNHEQFELKDKGVLIFSEGVKIEKGNESKIEIEWTQLE